MEENLADHLAFLPRYLQSGKVYDEPDLQLADSGVPCDTFNTVCGTRLAPVDAETRVTWAIEYFAAKRFPFAWWVGPHSTPRDLGTRLEAHGLRHAERESAMVLNLLARADDLPGPDDLRIRIVRSHEELRDYARVVAANWDPPDRWVMQVFEEAARLLLRPEGPSCCFVGYLDGEPVAASECFFSGGVAGIYNVVTLRHARRRGIGTAMTVAALDFARARGYAAAVLQASGEGERVYARLGFSICGEFDEYH